jgi:antitoxin VapB
MQINPKRTESFNQLTFGFLLYILSVYTLAEEAMKTAKVFKSGNSQAVRLPKEFQFDAREVEIFKQNGDVVLRPVTRTWKDYLDRGRHFTGDFPDRIDDQPPEERSLL